MNEPQIRFKRFHGVWIPYTLGEMVTFSKGSGYSKTDLCKDGNPIILYGRMYTKYESVIDTVDTFVIPKNNSVYSTGGEVIIPGSGESPEDISVASTVKNAGVILGGDLNILKFDTKLYDPTFMAMAITYSPTRMQLSVFAQGKTIVHLRNSDIAKGCVYFPHIEEQKVIARYVSSLDTQISTASSRLASLKQVKEASLQAMFPQKGETVPKIRFKGFEEEWVNVRLEDIGYCYTGLSGKTKEDFGAGTSWYISFLNVLTNAKIDTTLFEKVKVNKDEHQNEVHKGDLFFNTSSETPEEVGMCSVLDVETKNVYLNSFCFGFRITDNNINPLYIAYLIRSNIGRRIMSVLAQGATRFNLSKSNFYKIEIWVPSCIEEQQKIASYFTSLDKQIALQTQRLEKLRQIKAACLDKMFV